MARRSCKECWVWQYNERTGMVETFGGKPLRRRGKVPCLYAKCDKGTIDDPNEWLPCNWQAFNHWMECRAVGSFPDDPIVRRHAALLSTLHERLRDERESRLLEVLAVSNRGG